MVDVGGRTVSVRLVHAGPMVFLLVTAVGRACSVVYDGQRPTVMYGVLHGRWPPLGLYGRCSDVGSESVHHGKTSSDVVDHSVRQVCTVRWLLDWSL